LRFSLHAERGTGSRFSSLPFVLVPRFLDLGGTSYSLGVALFFKTQKIYLEKAICAYLSLVLGVEVVLASLKHP
jgi:hypothetical protein